MCNYKPLFKRKSPMNPNVKRLFAHIAPPARCHIDGHAFAVGGQVPDHLVCAPMANKAIRAAGRANTGRIGDFYVDVIVVVGFLDPLHLNRVRGNPLR